MKFSCKTSDLLQALQLVSRAISGQQALPILNNILFKVESGKCVLSATDLELSIVTHFDAAVESEGSVTVPAKAILNFAQYNSDPEVTLETHEGTQIRCTSKHGKTMLSGEASTEYPSIAPVERRTALELEAMPFLEALNLVTFASAKSTLRPVLSGVYVRTDGSKLILVATDSYRLSEYQIPLKAAVEEFACIIPVKVLDEVKMVLGARKTPKKTPDEAAVDEEKGKMPETLSVVMSSQQVEFQVGNTRLLSRLIEGKFPNYEQIIPKEFAAHVMIPTRELTTVVKRMHYFAKEVNNNLTFKIDLGEVQVSTPQTPLGKDEASIGAERQGEERKIALSSSYLLDFLGHVADDQVKVSVTDSLRPAVFHLPHNEYFLHLIMPLRMQEE
jgi:DNA polymerase-3 subunit beta